MTEAAVTVNSIVLLRILPHNHRMPIGKHTFAALLLASALAACGPVAVYYRAGADVARRDADLLNCEVSALRDAPDLPLFADRRDEGDEVRFELPQMPVCEHVVSDYQTTRLSLNSRRMPSTSRPL